MPKKKIPTGMRLSEDALHLMDQLAQKLGIDRTSVVEIAVRRFAEIEEIKATKKELPVTAPQER